MRIQAIILLSLFLAILGFSIATSVSAHQKLVKNSSHRIIKTLPLRR